MFNASIISIWLEDFSFKSLINENLGLYSIEILSIDFFCSEMLLINFGSEYEEESKLILIGVNELWDEFI